MKRLVALLFASALFAVMVTPVISHVNTSLVNKQAVWADGGDPIPPIPWPTTGGSLTLSHLS